MTINSFLLLLLNQFKSKWGRFILASGGIMIGVWAILLTTGLSFGLRTTLVDAINSRPEARWLQIYKTTATDFNFADFNSIPKFQGISEQDINDLKEDYPQITSTLPSLASRFAVRSFDADASYSCNTVYNENQQLSLELQAETGSFNAAESFGDATERQLSYEANCTESLFTLNDFDYLLNTQRTNWIGPQEEPGEGEIVMCFTCGSVNLGERLGLDKPEDLLGKTLDFEFLQASEQYVFAGEEYDVINGTGRPVKIESTDIRSYEVVAVIDDSDPSFSLGFSNAYLPTDLFVEGIELANPEALVNEPLFVEYSLFVEDFTQLAEVEEAINNEDEYLATALILVLVSGINGLFTGLSAVMALFGLVAFLASMFGIVTVISMSALERKKQIGILKSIGAKDSDIFFLFVLESTLLGMIGWVLGTILAVFTGFIISSVVNLLIGGNEDVASSLEVFNITGFGLDFPWWLFIVTLLLAVIVTVVSGIIPSYSASRQNPVDVLRSE